MAADGWGPPCQPPLSQAWVPGSVPLPRHEGEAPQATPVGPSCFFQASQLFPLSSIVNILPFPKALDFQTGDPGGTCSYSYCLPAPGLLETKLCRASSYLEKGREKGKVQESPSEREPCVLEPETLSGGPLCRRVQQVQCAFLQLRCADLASHPLPRSRVVLPRLSFLGLPTLTLDSGVHSTNIY